MATQTATGTGSKNNNGGVVVNGGTNAAGKFTTTLTSMDMTKDEKQYGNQIPQNTPDAGDDTKDVTGRIAADAGGTYAYFPNPRTDDLNVLVKAGGSQSDKINNDASKGNLLTVPGSEYVGVDRGKPNEVTGAQALGNPTWTYPVLPSTSRVPGLTRGVTEGSGYQFTSTTDGAADGADKNVYGTRTLAVPGEVTYRTGAAEPTTTNLRARDSVDTGSV